MMGMKMRIRAGGKITDGENSIENWKYRESHRERSCVCVRSGEREGESVMEREAVRERERNICRREITDCLHII